MTHQGAVSEWGNKTFLGKSTPAMVEGSSFFTFNYKHAPAPCRLTPSSSFDEQKHSHLLPYQNHMNYLWPNACTGPTPLACTHGPLAAAAVLVTFVHFLHHYRFNWWTFNWCCPEAWCTSGCISARSDGIMKLPEPSIGSTLVIIKISASLVLPKHRPTQGKHTAFGLETGRTR